jgi:acyl-CoA synthetase (AMP-forming)/AMP-acid ligase II
MFTSGTTGTPKGVMATHEQSISIRAFPAYSLGFRPGDRDLIPMPFFHGFGYKAGWLTCLITGATVYSMPVYKVDAVVESVQRNKITILLGPPTMYQGLLDAIDRDGVDLSSLRAGLTGATSVSAQLIEQIKSKLSLERLLTGYGLTETMGVVSMSTPEDTIELIATTAGRVVPGVEVEVRDADGTSVIGEPGEIVVRGPNVMKGYLDDEATTRDVIDEHGWFRTGDIGIIDENQYLKITDRLKDMYIVGGLNAYPAEIERMMLRHPAISEVAVIGVPDGRLGEVGMAFVVPRSGYDDEASIIAWCRSEMANFKVPRYVTFTDALPVNASGKVTKGQLRDQAEQILRAKAIAE